MTREEIIELRKATFERVERMRKTGDYAAGASDIRENAEAILKLYDHELERGSKVRSDLNLNANLIVRK